MRKLIVLFSVIALTVYMLMGCITVVCPEVRDCSAKGVYTTTESQELVCDTVTEVNVASESSVISEGRDGRPVVLVIVYVLAGLALVCFIGMAVTIIITKDGDWFLRFFYSMLILVLTDFVLIAIA